MPPTSPGEPPVDAIPVLDLLEVRVVFDFLVMAARNALATNPGLTWAVHVLNALQVVIDSPDVFPAVVAELERLMHEQPVAPSFAFRQSAQHSQERSPKDPADGMHPTVSSVAPRPFSGTGFPRVKPE